METEDNPVRNAGQFTKGFTIDGGELVLHPEDAPLVVEGPRYGYAYPVQPVCGANGFPDGASNGVPASVAGNRELTSVGTLDESSAYIKQDRFHIRLSGKSCVR